MDIRRFLTETAASACTVAQTEAGACNIMLCSMFTCIPVAPYPVVLISIGKFPGRRPVCKHYCGTMSTPLRQEYSCMVMLMHVTIK